MNTELVLVKCSRCAVIFKDHPYSDMNCGLCQRVIAVAENRQWRRENGLPQYNFTQLRTIFLMKVYRSIAEVAIGGHTPVVMKHMTAGGQVVAKQLARRGAVQIFAGKILLADRKFYKRTMRLLIDLGNAATHHGHTDRELDEYIYTIGGRIA